MDEFPLYHSEKQINSSVPGFVLLRFLKNQWTPFVRELSVNFPVFNRKVFNPQITKTLWQILRCWLISGLKGEMCPTRTVLAHKCTVVIIKARQFTTVPSFLTNAAYPAILSQRLFHTHFTDFRCSCCNSLSYAASAYIPAYPIVREDTGYQVPSLYSAFKKLQCNPRIGNTISPPVRQSLSRRFLCGSINTRLWHGCNHINMHRV